MSRRSHEALPSALDRFAAAGTMARQDLEVRRPPSGCCPLHQGVPSAAWAPDTAMQARALSRAGGSLLARTGPALLQLQRQYGNRYVQRVVGHARAGRQGPSAGNQTGLPDRLKAGLENLSGLSVEDVRVHYNSRQPARLQALAYTQGSEIYLGPGQERHLGHEAWHVVQQRQGRVRATTSLEGASINDDPALEKEADVMGRHASQGTGTRVRTVPNGNSGVLQEMSSVRPAAPTATDAGPIQRTVDTAAEALLKQGVKKVKKTDLSGKFAKTHNVSGSDLETVQAALDALRAARPAPPKSAVNNVRNPADRPTAGGMMEGDAAILAELNGWVEAGKSWKCDDPSHTPKGKVYTDGNVYYGADNTGHVGWGFKVWEKKNATTLRYTGNTVWDGNRWHYNSRGT